jgi:HAD superfamily hydrolase (TIGR01509 family)
MIRAVIFDFGGVLVQTTDHNPRRRWEQQLDLPQGGLEQLVHGSDLWISAQLGQLDPETYWYGIAERLRLPLPQLPTLRHDYFSGDTLQSDLVALLSALRQRGYTLGLLSNDSAVLAAKLDSLKLTARFDAICISAMLGKMKPDPASYLAACASVGFSPPECLFIDDNAANIAGARAVGMVAIHYQAGMDLAAVVDPYLAQDTTTTLIFDYGNVLDIPDDWAAWQVHLEAYGAQFGLTGKEINARIYHSEQWQLVKVGKIPYAEYLNAIFAPLGHTDPAKQVTLIGQYHTGRNRIHPEMLTLLRQLKPYYRLAVLSNAWQLEMAQWLADEVGGAGLFDDVISSAAVGMAKPDPEIYSLTCQRLGVKPSEALFIDDLVRNTKVAEANGLPCIIFEGPAQLRAALQKRRLLF